MNDNENNDNEGTKDDDDGRKTMTMNEGTITKDEFFNYGKYGGTMTKNDDDDEWTMNEGRRTNGR